MSNARNLARLVVDSGGGLDASAIGNVLAGKNRIINGDMQIDQRLNGSWDYTSYGSFIVDRWSSFDTGGFCAAGQNLAFESITPPTGFKNYFGIYVGQAHTVQSYDTMGIQQGIEGYNIADLNWGTPEASPVTLSFWVRSSLTGSFGAGISTSNNDYSYVFQYTISSADTWEYKTITIPGATGGDWPVYGALYLRFGTGVGTDYSEAVSSSWTTTMAAWLPRGSVNLVETNGATFYITGVQLEKGSVASPFEHRPYLQELNLCRRYYEVSASNFVTQACANTTSGWDSFVRFQVEKRTIPTVYVSSNTAYDKSVYGFRAKQLTSTTLYQTKTQSISYFTADAEL